MVICRNLGDKLLNGEETAQRQLYHHVPPQLEWQMLKPRNLKHTAQFSGSSGEKVAFKVASVGLSHFQIACLIERDFWQYLI